MAIAGEVEIGEGGAATEAVAASCAPSRAGERAISVLSTPLNQQILRSLAERPMRLAQLRKATGLPAQTTLRGHLASLGEIGALSKRTIEQMPYAVENQLTPMGRELLGVAGLLEAWLHEAPDGPISIEEGTARGAVKALADGWASTIMRTLAARPRSLTELDKLIPDHSYPALERRLASMRMAGLVAAQPNRGTRTPYAVTDWGRRGIVPLAAASHCERVHMGLDSEPVAGIDIEAAFLLAMPLVMLPPGTAGSCQLEVEPSPGSVAGPAGVRVVIERGRVVSCASGLEPDPDAYAAGSAIDWFLAVKDGDSTRLHLEGGSPAEILIEGLHAALRPG